MNTKDSEICLSVSIESILDLLHISSISEPDNPLKESDNICFSFSDKLFSGKNNETRLFLDASSGTSIGILKPNLLHTAGSSKC